MIARRPTNCGMGSSNWQTSTRRARGNGKAGAVLAGGQRQRQVGDQQGLAHLGLAAHKQDALRRQQSRFHQPGGGAAGCSASNWASDNTAGFGAALAAASFTAAPPPWHPAGWLH